MHVLKGKGFNGKLVFLSGLLYSWDHGTVPSPYQEQPDPMDQCPPTCRLEPVPQVIRSMQQRYIGGIFEIAFSDDASLPVGATPIVPDGETLESEDLDSSTR